MRVDLRLLAVAAAGALAVTSPLWGPRVLREIPWFEVERVEVSGTELLAPAEVLALAKIRPDRNLWDDTAELEAAIAAHPTVAAVTLTRRLPATLRLRIEEKRPLAYVEMETLTPITARGELLPVNPARVRLDLPVVRGSWRGAGAAYRSAILAEVSRLAAVDPALLARVSEIRGEGESPESLVLTHSIGEIVIPMGASAARVAELRAVLADIEGRLPQVDSAGLPMPPARLDLRFDQQIVVRLPSSGSLL